MSKEFKVRAQLLCKTMEQWAEIEKQATPFIPALGEVCIYTGDVFVEDPAPDVVLKVGDGVHPLAELEFISAKAGDVYAWAKQEHLQWVDMDAETFISPLDQHIKDTFEHDDTKYRIVSDGTHRWKLQKSIDNEITWSDASGVIDLVDDFSDIKGRLKLLENGDESGYGMAVKSKMKTATTPDRVSEIINNGIKAELNFDAANANKNKVKVDVTGVQVVSSFDNQLAKTSKFIVTPDGIFYVKGKESQTSGDEVVTMDLIKEIKGTTHLRGIATTDPKTATKESGYAVVLDTGEELVPADGDIVFYNSQEFLYVTKTDKSNGWRELGSEAIYATKNELNEKVVLLTGKLDAETTAREEADAALSSLIDTKAAELAEAIEAEESARQAKDIQLQTDLDAEVEARGVKDTELTNSIAVEKNRIDQIIAGTLGIHFEFSQLSQTDGEEIILNCNAE